MYPYKRIQRYLFYSGLSFLLVVCGTALISLRSVMYRAILQKAFALQADSYAFQMWKKNPVPLTIQFHLFNWTNAPDVFNKSIKPSFQDLGPYTFDETKEKVNITWNDNNGTVSFHHLKKWWYRADASNGSLGDVVVSVNPIALSSAATAKDWNFLLQSGMSIVLGSVGASVYGNHTVGEVLFDGYVDPLLTMAHQMPSLGNVPPFDKFGWFYTRNNSETYEGHFNMDTGVKGQLGELYTWKHMSQTPYNDDECGKVSGSAGEFFPSGLTKNSTVKLFSADLCRFIELEFKKELYIHGILAYMYAAGDRFLDNGTKIPENKCFCKGDCMPYGALDISACRYGSPAYVSLPHFHKADPFYRDIVDGMSPDDDKHDFYIVFEPITGFPLEVAARLQVNLMLQPISGVRMFRHVPKMYVPILWFEQTVFVPEDITFYISILIKFELICLCIGSAVILCGIVLKVCCFYRLCHTKMTLRTEETPEIKEQVPLTFKGTEGTY